MGLSQQSNGPHFEQDSPVQPLLIVISMPLTTLL
jgi:hypothetical protein